MRRLLVTASVIALALSLVAPAAGAAKVEFPKTNAGKRAAAYLKAFNSSNESDLAAYLEANLAPAALAAHPVEKRMEGLRQIRADVGALEAAKIVTARDDAVTIFAKSSSGKWLEIAFAFEKDAPNRLVGARFQLLDEPPDLAASTTPLTEAEVVKETRAFVEDLVSKDDFSGVVLIAKGENPVLLEAYGSANAACGAPNTPDTRFNLGSINKLITRIAIEQLAGSGALSLDDRMGTFLPDYPNKEAAGTVTIRNLVEMSSGIGDFFGTNYDAMPKNELRSIADYAPLFADERLHFEPGTSTEYSNGGYIVLGLIIERTTGKSYYDYVRDSIYLPAGMERTGHFMADVPEAGVATGYTRTWDGKEHPGEPRHTNIYSLPARGSSAGGGYSTAADLLRLILALEAGKLSAPGAAADASRGMAIAGGAPGISAFAETHPRAGYTVIVLSNYDPPIAVKVGQKIGSLITRVQ